MSRPLRPALASLRRRVYLTALPLGAVTIAAVWIIEWQQDVLHVFDRYGLPLLLAFFLLLWGALLRRRVRLERAEKAIFAVFSVFMIGSLSFTLFTPTPPGAEVGDLAGAGYWFPVVYCLAFLIFEERVGGRLALALFAVSLLLGAAHALVDPAAARAEVLIFSQLYVANGLVLLLVATFARVVRRRGEEALALERLATTDPLTGLGNRRRLEVRVDVELLRVSRYGGGFALVLFDLDHFKRVNDEHGHEVGDEVLRAVGRVLPGSLREVDTLGRWGGEEFVILAPELDRSGAERLAERLRAALEAHPFAFGAGAVSVTASFGVAVHRPGDTLASLVRRADTALYRAKKAGRNRVEAV